MTIGPCMGAAVAYRRPMPSATDLRFRNRPRRRGVARWIWARSSALAMGSEGESSADQLAAAFSAVDWPPRFGVFVAERYLTGLDAFERSATWFLLLHNRLRLAAILAGVGAPILLGVELAASSAAINWVAFGLSLTTATCLGIDIGFGLGDRWRHNRKTAEALKREGWLFVTGSGPYTNAEGEGAARKFHERVERLVQRHVDAFLDDISRDSESLALG
jgi:hypothetical protein